MGRSSFKTGMVNKGSYEGGFEMINPSHYPQSTKYLHTHLKSGMTNAQYIEVMNTITHDSGIPLIALYYYATVLMPEVQIFKDKLVRLLDFYDETLEISDEKTT